MAKSPGKKIIKEKKENYDVAVSLTVIMFLTLFVYSPSFTGGFLNWDDDAMIIENSMVRSISFGNIQKIFTTPHLNSYNPLVITVYACIYSIFRLDPKPFHFINIILHIINSLLVFWLIYLLCKNSLISVMTAILFSVHPAHVEAVSWITSLKELLFSFFYFLSLVSYVYWLNKKGKTIYYVLTFLFFLFSLLSKPVAVTIPAVMVLIDYYLTGKFELKTLINKIPYIAVSLLFAIVAVLTFSKGGMVGSEYSFMNNIFIFFHTLMFYLYKLVLPVNLSPIYPQPDTSNPQLPAIYYISPVVIAGITAFVYKFGKTYRVLIFGSVFFLISILPVSNLVPVKNMSLLFDRFTYLPYTGLMFAFSWFAVNIYTGKIFLQNKKHPIVILIVVLIISVFSFTSYKLATVWKNSESLWNNMIENYPDNPKGYFNLGEYYFKSNDYNRALSYYNKAVSLDSSNYFLFNDRGNAYRELKEYEKALSDYNKALSLKPGEPGVYNNMGIVYGYLNNFDSAMICFNKSLELSPSFVNAHLNIASYYFNLKNYDSAITVLNTAIRLNRSNPVIHYSLGLAYYNKQDYSKSAEHFRQAIKLDPEYETAYQHLSLAYYHNKEYDRAWDNIYEMMKKKFPVDAEFMEMLKRDSGRRY